MWPLADSRNDINRRDNGIASGTIPTLSPGVCKVHAHAVFFPQKVDVRNAFSLAHDLGCCRAVPSARYLPPLGPFLELWFNYKGEETDKEVIRAETRHNTGVQVHVFSLNGGKNKRMSQQTGLNVSSVK